MFYATCHHTPKTKHLNHYMLENLSTSAKIVFVLLLSLLSFLVCFLLGLLLVKVLYGTSGLALPAFDASSTSTISAFKVMQVMQTIGLFIIPAIVAAMAFSKTPWSYLKFSSTSSKVLGLAAIATVVMLPAINLMASANELLPLPQWLNGMEENAKRLTEAFLRVDSISALLFNLFMIAVLPAIGEELLFRGLIQKLFTKVSGSNFWGVFIAALVFSAIHFQFKGFLPRLALGMVFGYMLVWSRSIWVPIVAHFTNNAFAVLAYHFVHQGNLPAETETVGSLQQLWPIGIVSLALTALLLFEIKKRSDARSLGLGEEE